MKTFPRVARGSAGCALSAAVFLALGLRPASPEATGQGAGPVPITKATISPRIPTEVVDGNGSPAPVQVVELPVDFFDDLSWRSFLALNWPAKENVRGEADSAKKVDDEGPRVWETWKADYEIFQPGGREPTEWASFDAVTPCPDIPFLGGGKERI